MSQLRSAAGVINPQFEPRKRFDQDISMMMTIPQMVSSVLPTA